MPSDDDTELAFRNFEANRANNDRVREWIRKQLTTPRMFVPRADGSQQAPMRT
jgi:hypothetical protein